MTAALHHPDNVTPAGMALESHTIEVRGARIRYVLSAASCHPDRIPALLVHGGSANGAWWHPVMDHLERPAVAVDVSGHGTSQWRGAYRFDDWVAEVQAVAAHCFPDGCALVGHSLGGALVCAAALAGTRTERIIMIDSDAAPPSRPPRQRTAARVHARFADAVAAVAAHKPRWPASVLEHVAARSVAPVEGGWRVSRDPAVSGASPVATDLGALAPLPVDIILGRDSRFAPLFERTHRRVRERGLNHVVFHEVAGVGHDVMMEAPDRTAALIEQILDPTAS